MFVFLVTYLLAYWLLYPILEMLPHLKKLKKYPYTPLTSIIITDERYINKYEKVHWYKNNHLKELGHDGLHAHQGEDDCQERGSRERDVGVELQHLKEVHDEDEDLVLGVSEQHGDGHGLNEILINFMRKISKPCQLSLIN